MSTSSFQLETLQEVAVQHVLEEMPSERFLVFWKTALCEIKLRHNDRVIRRFLRQRTENETFIRFIEECAEFDGVWVGYNFYWKRHFIHLSRQTFIINRHGAIVGEGWFDNETSHWNMKKLDNQPPLDPDLVSFLNWMVQWIIPINDLVL